MSVIFCDIQPFLFPSNEGRDDFFCPFINKKKANPISMVPKSKSKICFDITLVVNTPRMEPGIVQIAKIIPALKSTLLAFIYAIDPEIALQATTPIEIAVIESGFNEGIDNIKRGTRIKPPPAPIKVPIVPIKNPITTNKKILSMVLKVI